MISRILARKRGAAVATLAVILTGCLALLLADHLRWRLAYSTEREALQTAEDAAQQSAEAANQLEQIVERQTAHSLRLKRRGKLTGIMALVTAGGLVLLCRSATPQKPAMPRTLVDCLPKRREAPTKPHDALSQAVAAPPEPPVDLRPLQEIIRRVGRDEHRAIALLHAVQEGYRYLPKAVLQELSRLTGVSLAQFQSVASFYSRFRTKPCGKHLVRVCRGTACHVAGADRVVDELRRGLNIDEGTDTDSAGLATVETVGCMGCCSLAPAVQRDDQLLANVRVEDLPEIIEACHEHPPRNRKGYRPFRKQTLRHSSESAATPLLSGSDTAAPRVVTQGWDAQAGADLSAYEREGGFAALAKCLSQLNPAEIIDEVRTSGLRGRGGGGFPVARKWLLVSQQSGDKYVIANGDEGDPGAFMDRSIMESAPLSVVEGLMIAARAVGATTGIVYVRDEYPLAVRRITEAVSHLRDKGYLGTSILGSNFAFDIEIVKGAGAFVCGEETALIESVMGRRGTPHLRPPFPAESGLWGQPTLINNVETLACVPWILRHGGAAFAAMGTPGSAGTKVFSLAGKVQHGGLVEAPMGVTIRQLVEDYGGGVAPGRTFKAVQIGGPSGGCLPAELADTPVDYEALRESGAIMGSGGLVVLDDTDCMVDVARYFLSFTQQESCGHCTFCRVGTRKLLDMLERLCAGKGSHRDLHEIESLAVSVTQGSLCGLGKTAPNPVLTTLRYFRDEYEAHLDGRCPAGRCKALVSYHVTGDCVGCTLCAQHCPVAAIEATPYRQHFIENDLCTRCDACRTTCPEQAIVTASPAGGRPSIRRKPSSPPVQVA